jgi:hypothetical protein
MRMGSGPDGICTGVCLERMWGWLRGVRDVKELHQEEDGVHVRVCVHWPTNMPKVVPGLKNLNRYRGI